MKKNTIMIFVNLTSYFLIIILFSLLLSTQISAKDYQPEISGSFESGDRLFTDPGLLNETEDEIVDYYRYNKQWLRYRQKLDAGEYYYLKLQRKKRVYDHSQAYDNLNLETVGNYTFYLTENLRNRFKLLLRDKDYLISEYQYKDYQLARLQYTLQYELNENHDYQLILQKQWTEYDSSPEKDYRLNRISLKWGWDVSDSLDLDTKLQYDQQLNDSSSGSTNKSGRKISLNFKYKL